MTFEAAVGITSRNISYASEWAGWKKRGGLLAKEFAFRAAYREDQHLYYSLTFGRLEDYDEARTWAFASSDLGGPPGTLRKVTFIRPTAGLSAEFVKMEVGVLFYESDIDSLESIFKESAFAPCRNLRPMFELGFGEKNLFFYLGYLNSFPIATAGIVEIGIKGYFDGLLEHKLFAGMTDYQDIALGYRGEIRIYKKIAITPGFSLGGKDSENVYTFTIGVKSLVAL